MEPNYAKEMFIIIIPISVLLVIISQCDCCICNCKQKFQNCKSKCKRSNRVNVQPIVVHATPIEGQISIIVVAEPLQPDEIERENTPTVDAIAINIQ